MNSEQFVAAFKQLTTEMCEVMERKNRDYARGSDPFKNFRRHGAYGIVVRLDDKLSRLDSLLRPGSDGIAAVSDESIEDTFKDAANYALLGLMTYREMKYGAGGELPRVNLVERVRELSTPEPGLISEERKLSAVHLGHRMSGPTTSAFSRYCSRCGVSEQTIFNEQTRCNTKKAA